MNRKTWATSPSITLLILCFGMAISCLGGMPTAWADGSGTITLHCFEKYTPGNGGGLSMPDDYYLINFENLTVTDNRGLSDSNPILYQDGGKDPDNGFYTDHVQITDAKIEWWATNNSDGSIGNDEWISRINGSYTWMQGGTSLIATGKCVKSTALKQEF